MEPKLNMLKPLPSGDVPPGAPGEVRIGMWAVGPDMRLFLNGRYQFSITDKSYPIGTIGVFVNSAGEYPRHRIFLRSHHSAKWITSRQQVRHCHNRHCSAIVTMSLIERCCSCINRVHSVVVRFSATTHTQLIYASV